MLDARAVHVEDLSWSDEFPEGRAFAQEVGYRTVLSVPLLREGLAIGAVTIRRLEVKPFSDRQIALLQTFADQAVIAIENVRLFTELAALNADLSEALEQQTATAEILRVIASSPTEIQPVLDAVVQNAARLCEAQDALIRLREGDDLVARAQVGEIPITAIGKLATITHGWTGGRALLERRTVHVHDLATAGEEFPQGKAASDAAGIRTALAVPLLREREAIGVVLIRRTEVRPFSDRQIALLQTFADQAVIAIENVRLFTELQEKNRALTEAHAQVTEALEQQMATGEILRAISQSPTDVQPVFDAIVRNAVRLCDGLYGFVGPFDGERIHFAAHHNFTPEALEVAQRMYPRRPDRRQVAGRVILTGAVVRIDDVLDDPEYAHDLARAGGWRAILGVPLLRDGSSIGTICVIRERPGPFSEAQVGPAPDLRRPGGHRDRERATVQGAGGAQRRADRGARPADGHRRGAPGHQPRPDGRPARVRHHCGERPSAVRRWPQRRVPLRRRADACGRP